MPNVYMAILCNFVAMIKSGKRRLFGVPVSTLQATFHAIDMHRYNLTLSDRGKCFVCTVQSMVSVEAVAILGTS